MAHWSWSCEIWYGDSINTAIHYNIQFVGNYMHDKGVEVSGYAHYMKWRQNSNRNKMMIMITSTTTTTTTSSSSSSSSSSSNDDDYYDKNNYLVWFGMTRPTCAVEKISSELLVILCFAYIRHINILILQ